MMPSAATAPTRPTIGPHWNEDPFGVWPVSMSMATQLYDSSAREIVTTMRRPWPSADYQTGGCAPEPTAARKTAPPGCLIDPKGRPIYIAANAGDAEEA